MDYSGRKSLVKKAFTNTEDFASFSTKEVTRNPQSDFEDWLPPGHPFLSTSKVNT